MPVLSIHWSVNLFCRKSYTNTSRTYKYQISHTQTVIDILYKFKNYVENKNTFMSFPFVSDKLIPTNKCLGVPTHRLGHNINILNCCQTFFVESCKDRNRYW